MKQDQASEKPARRSGRSPSYPGFDLATCIDRARKLYQAEKLYPAPMPTIVSHWGYTNPSGGTAAVQYAALKKFGLLSEEGSGEQRTGQLTELAQEILRSPSPREPIQRAALNPIIHRELWEKYGRDLPSDARLHWELLQRGFTENGAKDFVKQYRSTLAFAFEEDTESNPSMPPTPAPLRPTDTREPEVPRLSKEETGISATEPNRPKVTLSATRIPIPLHGGQMITIEGDFPVSEEAWENFLAVLDALGPGLANVPTKRSAQTGKQ